MLQGCTTAMLLALNTIPLPLSLRPQLLQEADPSYPARALKYEQVMALLDQGKVDLALLGLQDLEGSEEKARAVLKALNPPSGSANQVCGV